MSETLSAADGAKGPLLRALAALARAPLDVLLTLIGFGALLALPAAGFLISERLTGLAHRVTGQPELTVFLPGSADRKTALGIEEKLKALPGVAKTRLLPREETLARLKAKGGAMLSDALAVLPDNPFPDAIIVTPASDAPATLEALAAVVRQWREVEHVQADVGWARGLAALKQLLTATAWLLGSLIGAALIASVFNTLRLMAMLERARQGISAASEASFDTAAFLWRGLLLGLAAGLTAWAILCCAILWLRLPVAELGALYGFEITLALPDLRESAGLLGISSLLGGVGAWLASFSGRR